MTPRKRLAAFRIDDDLIEPLETAAKDLDRPISYLIRKAIRAWLENENYLKPERKRVGPRKRS